MGWVRSAAKFRDCDGLWFRIRIRIRLRVRPKAHAYTARWVLHDSDRPRYCQMRAEPVDVGRDEDGGGERGKRRRERGEREYKSETISKTQITKHSSQNPIHFPIRTPDDLNDDPHSLIGRSSNQSNSGTNFTNQNQSAAYRMRHRSLQINDPKTQFFSPCPCR